MVCAMCGRTIRAGSEIHATIEGREYIFDKDECLVICEKLKSVYGGEFCLNLTA
jgi:hypothetical protein